MEKIFNYPFAKDGDRNTAIPEANAQDNSVSMQSGWTLPYELNPANGGKYIERKDMNEILFRAFDGINQVAEAVDKWTKLTTENLNDIKQAGRYFQSLNAQATNERNYPINLAGYLIVINTNISGFAVTQIYKVYNSEKIYIRRTTSATSWSAWDSFVLNSEFNNKITSLQNIDTNLNNNKEDKTYYHTQYLTNLNNVKDDRFYSHGLNTENAFNTATNYIFNIGAEDGAWVRQISFPCTGNEIGLRRTTEKNNLNSWSAWDSVALRSYTDATYRKIADSYTRTETNSLLNQKEDKTYYSLAYNPTLNAVKDNRFYSHGTNYTNAFNTQSNYVFNIGAESGAWVRQISFPCASNEIGVRRIQTKDNMNSWGAWDSLILTSTANSTFRKIADSYTKTETDAKINNAVTAKGQRVKALWASVNISDGTPTIEYQIGGCSISKIAINKWRITHNIGNLQYIPTGNILPFNDVWEAGCNITAITNNYIEVLLPEYDNLGTKARQITVMIAY